MDAEKVEAEKASTSTPASKALRRFLQQVITEMDPEEGIEEPYKVCLSFNWLQPSSLCHPHRVGGKWSSCQACRTFHKNLHWIVYALHLLVRVKV